MHGPTHLAACRTLQVDLAGGGAGSGAVAGVGAGFVVDGYFVREAAVSVHICDEDPAGEIDGDAIPRRRVVAQRDNQVLPIRIGRRCAFRNPAQRSR